jgi:hypothetical protein
VKVNSALSLASLTIALFLPRTGPCAEPAADANAPRKATLCGRVLGPEGKPMSGVWASFQVSSAGRSSSQEGVSGDDGTLSVSDLVTAETYFALTSVTPPAGWWVVKVEGSLPLNVRAGMSFRFAPKGDAGPDFVIRLGECPAKVSGVARDENGQAVPGARVRLGSARTSWGRSEAELLAGLVKPGFGPRRGDNFMAVAGPDGKYTLAVPPGRYVVQAAYGSAESLLYAESSSWGGAEGVEARSSAEAALDIVLKVGAALRVTVVNGEGGPVEGAQIRFGLSPTSPRNWRVREALTWIALVGLCLGQVALIYWVME